MTDNASIQSFVLHVKAKHLWLSTTMLFEDRLWMVCSHRCLHTAEGKEQKADVSVS